MRLTVVLFVFLFALAAALNASNIGITVNGTCEAGSCPAVPIPFNATDTLPVNFVFTLANGDSYLINGSFTATNNSNGGGFSAGHLFQVTYEGNAGGGASSADTINVGQLDTFQTTVGSVVFSRDLIGGFGPTIAASSSASSCVNATLGCLGPANPPGSFNLPTSFSLDSTGGVFLFDPTFTNNFGAGSPVGSYVVWGQTTALPPPAAPEPASLALLALGLGAVTALHARRP
jgi:hypothetical protein